MSTARRNSILFHWARSIAWRASDIAYLLGIRTNEVLRDLAKARRAGDPRAFRRAPSRTNYELNRIVPIPDWVMSAGLAEEYADNARLYGEEAAARMARKTLQAERDGKAPGTVEF